MKCLDNYQARAIQGLLWKKFEIHSAGQVFDVFKELNGPLPSSQKPVIASYPEQIKSNAHHHALVL